MKKHTGMKRQNGVIRRKYGFTLVEVVVSLGILAVSLATLFQMTTSARAQLTKAEQQWHYTHMLSQAAEYILLHRWDEQEVPEDFFPYKDYEISVSYEEVDDEQIYEDYLNIDGQLPLELCVIELYAINRAGNRDVVDELLIERIIYEDYGLVPE